MGRQLGVWLVGMVLMCASAQCWSDIRTTPHSLVRRSTMQDVSEVCVFCHAPSIGSRPPQVAPAWQHAIGAEHVFTIYDDIGRFAAGDKPSVGSQSIACLSCHDSNQAFSVTKLSFDHPFGVPYRGYSRRRPVAEPGIVARPDDAEPPAVKAKHLKVLDEFREPTRGVVESRSVWWVSSAQGGPLRTRNDLPLYSRPDGLDQDVPFIECSSCHDPHSSNQLFLRVTNEGSRLCLTCHDK